MRSQLGVGNQDLNLVNLTPHTITVIGSGETDMVIAASGQVARVSSTDEIVDYLSYDFETPSGIDGNEFPIYVTRLGEVVGLPDPEEGTVYLVSGMVRSAVHERQDVWSPGPLVRDDKGQPIGCKGFYRNG